RDVAGAEDERDLALGFGLLRAPLLAVDAALRRRLALLDPDLGADAAHHHLVHRVAREHLRDHAAIAAGDELRHARRATLLEGLDEEAHVAHGRDRTAEPLLARGL